MSRWDVEPLGNLLDLVIDHRGKTPKKMGFDDFHDSGYPVLSAKHVKTDELVNVDAIRFANEEMYQKWMKVETQEGDIALTSEAPMGEVFYLDGEVKYVLGQRVFGLRAKEGKIDPRYLVAWLASSRGQEQLSARASGSTVLGIKQSELLKIEVDTPPLSVQAEIAKVRFDLTKKIAVNRQINQTLEQIAQAIFKSWFVDFEPVKAKQHLRALGGNDEQTERAAQAVIAGAVNLDVITTATDLDALDQQLIGALEGRLAHQTDAQREQLTETASHFPDQLIESDRGSGSIPETWETVPFSSLAKLDTTSVKPFEAPDVDWEHYSIPAFDAGRSPSFERGDLIKSNKYRVNPTSVLVSKLNPQVQRIWYPSVRQKSLAICSTEFMQFVPNSPAQRPFILGLVSSGPFQAGVLQRVTGSTGSRQRAQPKSVAEMGVPDPGQDLRKSYSDVVGPSLQAMNLNIEEIESLAALRDALLPKLLSGELELEAGA